MASAVAAEEMFRQLADSLALNGAPHFFSDLVTQIARLLGVDHVIVAEVPPDSGLARTIAVCSGGELAENFQYPLAGTPCEGAAGKDSCCYPEGVARRFPQDRMLTDMGVEGYFGQPMLAQDGTPVGLLAVMSRGPLKLPPGGEELLRIAAAQAGAELTRRQVEQSLRESERRLNTLMDHLPGMAYRCRNDAHWTMEFVSQGVEALTGFEPQALLYNRQVAYVSLIHPGDRDRVDAEVQASVRANRHYRCIYRLINARGELRWVWEQGQAVREPGRPEVLLEGFICDITEQHESERVQEAVAQTATAITSRLGHDFFLQLVQHLARALDADMGFVATRQEGDWMRTQALVVAGQAQENLQYRLSESPCARLLEEGECVGRYEPPMPMPGGSGEVARTYVGRRLDNALGKPIGTLMVCYADPQPDLNLATSVLRILAAGAAGELERQTNDRRIHQLAYVDGTTGLPNRIHFMEQLDRELARARETRRGIGLVLVDIKRFKEINDVLGHKVGDQLLVAVARRLEVALAHGEFLARLSGDEFALLVPELGRGALDEVIDRLHAALLDPVAAAEREFSVGLNLGAACYPDDAADAADLFQCASVAMHEAKRNETGICVFDVAIARSLHRRRTLVERFSDALAEGRLALRYQPQVALPSGELVGAEVLCRWYDEQWGWVAPSEFIPLAEERGLIRELGQWVLGSATEQLRHWQARGLVLPGRLSVNLSALQFTQLTLVDEVKALTRGVAPEAVGLELTESAFLRDPERAVEITRRLQESGYGLAIDDFGTGYSSLSYLRRFAADSLKIDMSFVRHMLDNASDYTIVTTIIAMAHSLGMATVAEGVEEPAQAEALARLGCDRAQGFCYDRPLDSARFAERWLEKAPDRSGAPLR